MQKCLPSREFSPPLCHCAEGRQSPRQLILETNLAPLQVWVLGSFKHGHPTLSSKISVARSQVIDHGGVYHNKLLGLHELSEGHLRDNSRPLGFPTPREAWISSPWLLHLGTAFRRF
jgi:hypothetical protein